MTKSKINSVSPLLSKYRSLDETERAKVRDSIIEESGISFTHFYYLLRQGKAQKLVREVFAKHLKATVIELFPYISE
ncbi:MAG TPA: hypothetical protein PKD91_05855 [Bacteroidia bacterium]|nr:hypothetical protein [Bacteroidia bacterium]